MYKRQILNVPDEPGMSFKIFGLLAQKNINVDIILQSTGRDGKKDISFTLSLIHILPACWTVTAISIWRTTPPAIRP